MAPIARLTAVALTLLAALAGATALSAPAHAEAGYTYWAYYHLTDGTWVASSKGANGITPADGAVEGFRYATTLASSMTPDRPPRATPAFEDICAGTEAAQGQKRIGIVVDYGTPQDAAEGDTPPRPEAACAVVPADATTQQALESVKPLRLQEGLMCAVDGYPSSGCADEVKNATVPEQEKQVDLAMPGDEGTSESGNSAGVAAIVAAAVVVLGGGGFLVARRRAA